MNFENIDWDLTLKNQNELDLKIYLGMKNPGTHQHKKASQYLIIRIISCLFKQ